MDSTTQVVLVIMIVVLGSTLTVVGIMFAFFLKDLRESVTKFNKILTDVEVISGSLSSGSVQIEQAIASLRSAIDTVKNQAASPVGSIFGVITFLRQMMNQGGDEDE